MQTPHCHLPVLLHSLPLPAYLLPIHWEDDKNKRQAVTKGHGAAWNLSQRRPRCRLIAADISPVLFNSKVFRYVYLLLSLHTKEARSLKNKCHHICQPLCISFFWTKFSLSHGLFWQYLTEYFWSYCTERKVNTHWFSCHLLQTSSTNSHYLHI